jgi:hypothetical protein
VSFGKDKRNINGYKTEKLNWQNEYKKNT